MMKLLHVHSFPKLNFNNQVSSYIHTWLKNVNIAMICSKQINLKIFRSSLREMN